MKRRNSSDSHLRALERRVLAGDLTAVMELARVYERVGRDEPPFDVREQTRRLVADVELVEETGQAGSIRDVLTELTHIARERNVGILELLSAAIEVADEEEASTPCPDCGGERTPEGRGLVPGFWVDRSSGQRHRIATADPCERDWHDGPDEESEVQEGEIVARQCQGRLGFGPFERQCESTIPCTLHPRSRVLERARCRACVNGFPLEMDECPFCGRTRE